MKWWEVPTFRPIQPQWLTSTVVALLRNDMEYSSILADALDDAGCNDGKLLIILREGSDEHKKHAFKHLTMYPDQAPRFQLTQQHMQEMVETLMTERLEKLPIVVTHRMYSSRSVRYYYYLVANHAHTAQMTRTTDPDVLRYACREECAYLINEMCRQMYREFVSQIGVDLKFL